MTYTIEINVLFSLIFCLIVVYWVKGSKLKNDERPFGLGKGIVVLLAQWTGLNVFFASPQMSHKYGVIGLFGYSLAGLAGFLLVYLIINKFIQHHNSPLFDKVHYINTGHSGRLMGLLSLLYRLENMTIAILAGKIISYHFFHSWNIVIIICLTMIIIRVTIYGYDTFYTESFIIVILSYISTVLIPTLVYLKVSVPTVYSGVNFLTTEMLELNNPAHWLLVFALFIRFCSYGVLNIRVWDIYGKIKKTKRGISFVLSAFLWLFIPLSIATLSFVAQAEAIWPQSHDEVSVVVTKHLGGQFGIAMYIVTLIVILLATVTANIGVRLNKYSVFSKSGIVLMACLLVIFLPYLTVLDVMLYFSLIWAAVAPVVLLVKDTSFCKTVSLITVGVSIVVGIYFTIASGIQYGIIADFVTSLCGMLCITFIHPWLCRKGICC